jgi:NCS1 family nucleobase:cation symporter-1
VAVQVPFIDQAFYTGPMVAVLGGTDISWVVGGVAGFAFYLVALRVPARGAEMGTNGSFGIVSGSN